MNAGVLPRVEKRLSDNHATSLFKPKRLRRVRYLGVLGADPLGEALGQTADRTSGALALARVG